ncbi:odorant receptor 131-2-like [Thalassophryne amazonica]|uniref:odorant receptor 131-2-like n=1 Tax=Thalassophryne amazonica TaxID=390379 RepID=UPI001471EDA4|nr:odorant receptor 131-2-like [Thalassophryne amazonica]
MSYGIEPQSNVSAGVQYQGLVERVIFSILITLPGYVFLFINGTMLFTLNSKVVFCETPRYVLLFNLLLADTLHLVENQVMYILAVSRVRLTYPACGVLTMANILTSGISPLTLVVMSLERYVAVCYPLRHANIVTMTNTVAAICVVWFFCAIHILIHVVLLLEYPFEELESLQLNDVCSEVNILIGPSSTHYNMTSKCVLFVLAAAVIICSYISVVVAARSASTDKASAQKARNTLLLHLVQLSLSLISNVESSLVIFLIKILDRITIIRIRSVLYVCIYLLPRCLSPLIYGLRDPCIRSLLMENLCCHLKLSAIRAKT